MIGSGARDSSTLDANRPDRLPSTSIFNATRFAGVAGLCLALGACSAREGAPTASVAPTPAPERTAAAAPGAAQAVALQTPVAQSAPVVVSASPVARPLARPAAGANVAVDGRIGRGGAGLASWYGDRFHGRPTANGERFDMGSLTAAHRSFPLPSYVRVTNVQNGRSIVVRVNDRGPFHGGRVIDVSSRAADVLGFKSNGVGAVKLDLVGRAPASSSDDRRLLASYQEFGRPAAAPGMQMAMAPVSDGELAAETSTGGAFAVASAAVSKSVAVVRSSASAVASTARAAVRTVLPGASTSTPAPQPAAASVVAAAPATASPVASGGGPTSVAYAAPQPLITNAPAAILAPKSTGKRVVAPTDPVLASVAPAAAHSAAPVTAAPAPAYVDVSSRISASFEGF